MLSNKRMNITILLATSILNSNNLDYDRINTMNYNSDKYIVEYNEENIRKTFNSESKNIFKIHFKSGQTEILINKNEILNTNIPDFIANSFNKYEYKIHLNKFLNKKDDEPIFITKNGKIFMDTIELKMMKEDNRYKKYILLKNEDVNFIHNFFETKYFFQPYSMKITDKNNNYLLDLDFVYNKSISVKTSNGKIYNSKLAIEYVNNIIKKSINKIILNEKNNLKYLCKKTLNSTKTLEKIKNKIIIDLKDNFSSDSYIITDFIPKEIIINPQYKERNCKI